MLKTESPLDSIVERVRAQSTRFARMRPADKAALVRSCLPALAACAQAWVEAACQAKGLPPDSPASGEEWLAGPYPVARFLKQLAHSLDQIARHNKPRLGRAMREVANGQLGVQVFPVDLFDALSISGTSAEVQFMPGIDPELARAHQAAFYARSAPSGSLSLVLGAGGQWLSVDEGRDEPYSAASDLKNSHRR